ncbi:MAG TPA: ABC transporter ATP-binding protein [Mycobacteriales bacterium]|nr:ABC transporter ATP-binding protein [Mycobacteriales bacterium]
MASIVLAGLSKVYGGSVRAVDRLDLSIVDGEFFALLGPSGCGKTTLLRMIAGLAEATEGSVSIGDVDVTALPPGKRNVAMVFQDYALFPHMTVADNIGYPLKIKRVPREQRQRRVAEVASALGLAGLLDRRPAALSGGQQQRAALARAVACHPTVFLFDEPLSNLDARLRLEARTFLKKLQRDLGVTTVFVTHDQAEALALADRIAVMDAGRIRQLGTPREVFGRPANTFVASFIGSTPMNLLAGTVVGPQVEVHGQRVALPDAWRAAVAGGQQVTVGVRPEHLDLSPSAVEGGLHGVVAIVENLGAASLVTLEADGFSVAATVPEGSEPRVGTAGWVRPRPGRLLLYDADGELLGTTAVPSANR